MTMMMVKVDSSSTPACKSKTYYFRIVTTLLFTAACRSNFVPVRIL